MLTVPMLTVPSMINTSNNDGTQINQL